MFSRIFSAGICGLNASIIGVEADVSAGLPQFSMVGLLSSEIREARDRILRAFSNSGIDLPPRNITVNLSPASIHKQGSGFDMPIAVAILDALGLINHQSLEGRLFAGELSLDGRFNRINGILPIALAARKNGFRTLVIPKENIYEGAVIDGISVCGVSSLSELLSCLNTDTFPEAVHIDLDKEIQHSCHIGEPDFSDIRGQYKAKRAAMLAVAGFHNLLFIGPPGSGKSMIAKRIPTILNRLTKEEILEISGIYSVMGLLDCDSLIFSRPFRAPHHSITGPALIGGRRDPRPGEITLAHKGVLFLDEAPEFKKDVIQMLRQPLEDKQVVISRSSGNMVFPADFMLVMAANPCQCGYYPDRHFCRCSQIDIDRYFGRLKGPLLDRVDICVALSKLNIEDFSGSSGMSSEQMREKVIAAQKIQAERFEGTNIRYNSQMKGKDIEKYCSLTDKCDQILNKAYSRYNLSARGYYKVLRVARTIADLDGCKDIGREQLVEAIGYRNTYE